MDKSKSVQLNLSIPKSYRDLLRTIAAETTLKNPDMATTASALGKQILCSYLDSYRQGDMDIGSQERTEVV